MVESSKQIPLAYSSGRTINIRKPVDPLTEGKIYLGVIFYTCNEPDAKIDKYSIFMGPKKSFDNINLIALKRVPERWQPNLNEHFANYSATRIYPSKVGTINYRIPPTNSGLIAYSVYYYPCRSLETGAARKLPYFIEAITTHHIKTTGISHISTSEGPEVVRIKQLEKVNLPVNEPVPIDRWLMGMGRGIRTVF
jgi:hypothetical protein